MSKFNFDIQLTEHFKLSEFFVTNHKYDNVDLIVHGVYNRILFLARTLEDLRERIEAPIIITSGYRSSKLNDMVQGAANSYHTIGCAVDFTFKFDDNYTDNYNKAASILESFFDNFQNYEGKYYIAELFGSRSCRFFHLAINAVQPDDLIDKCSSTFFRDYKHIKNLNFYE